MFKFLLSILALTIITDIQAFSGVGRGIEKDPYIVSSCDQLGEITEDIQAYYKIVRSFSCGGIPIAKLVGPSYFRILLEPVTLDGNISFLITEDSNRTRLAFHVER